MPDPKPDAAPSARNRGPSPDCFRMLLFAWLVLSLPIYGLWWLLGDGLPSWLVRTDLGVLVVLGLLALIERLVWPGK